MTQACSSKMLINYRPITQSRIPKDITFFFFSFSGWGETESTWYVGHSWPIVPAPDDRWWWLWRSWWNEDWQGKPKYWEKTCPVPLCPPEIPPDLGSNPGRGGGKPATNRLSYGTARDVTLQNGSRQQVHRGFCLFVCFFDFLNFRFWRWKKELRPNSRLTSSRLHGVTFQKVSSFSANSDCFTKPFPMFINSLSSVLHHTMQFQLSTPRR
jgi:hypothetical protein